MYAYGCRCGGAFAVLAEEMEKADEEEEDEDGGLLVCCDTCSLSVVVTAQRKPRSPSRAGASPQALGAEDTRPHQHRPSQLRGPF